jgi:hypothetical protein
MSTITEQDIKALTPEHRIVWHQPPGQPVEMGLYVDEDGFLCTDVGHGVRSKNGLVPSFACDRIVQIIPPAFVPRVGMVIGHPDRRGRRLTRVDDADVPWLGHAPEISSAAHWFGDINARRLIENHGWVVMGDLSAPGREGGATA